jgi:hypothetical protein
LDHADKLPLDQPGVYKLMFSESYMMPGVSYSVYIHDFNDDFFTGVINMGDESGVETIKVNQGELTFYSLKMAVRKYR